MKRRSLRYGTLAVLMSPVLLASCADSAQICEASDGVEACKTVNDYGESTLALRTAEPAGTHCPNGGTRIDTGFDRNGNGELDAPEIDVTGYICDGADGATGATNVGRDGKLAHDSLVETTAFDGLRGDCASGGVEIATGVDDGGTTDTADDGVLGASEVDATQVLCNSADGGGATGATGAAGATGAVGGTGAVGATGSGADGATGATGTAGLDDTTAGATGATGASGLDGDPGPTGATGASGADGNAGATGATGPLQGATGTVGTTGATGGAGATGIGIDSALVGVDGVINGQFETGDLFGWDATDFHQMLGGAAAMRGNYTPEFNFKPTHGVPSLLSQYIDLRHTQFFLPAVAFLYSIPPNADLTSVTLSVSSIDVDTGNVLETVNIRSGSNVSAGVVPTSRFMDLPNSKGHLINLVLSWQSDLVDPSGATIRFDRILVGEDD